MPFFHMTIKRWELLRAIVFTFLDASEKWQIHFHTLVYPCLTLSLRLFDHLEDSRILGYLERHPELDLPIELDM